MKYNFHHEPLEYFLTRPINPEFLEYAAKDVEDLGEIALAAEKAICVNIGSIFTTIKYTDKIDHHKIICLT